MPSPRRPSPPSTPPGSSRRASRRRPPSAGVGVVADALRRRPADRGPRSASGWPPRTYRRRARRSCTSWSWPLSGLDRARSGRGPRAGVRAGARLGGRAESVDRGVGSGRAGPPLPGRPRTSRRPLTWPSGPASRCETPGPASARSELSCASVPTGWSSCEDDEAARDSAPPRLLGAFDPLLLGWRRGRRSSGERTGIVTNNGIFRPFALVAGRAVATWTLVGGGVRLVPFDELASSDLASLTREAEDVVRFLGLSGGEPRSRS